MADRRLSREELAETAILIVKHGWGRKDNGFADLLMDAIIKGADLLPHRTKGEAPDGL